jgi:hypothetical protein
MVANTPRGQREVADIISAALAQGWTRKTTGATGKRGTSRNNSHIYLVPPTGGVPVGIASSPSDIHQRHQVIRKMRRGGLIWPPPQKEKSRKEDEVFMLTEVIAAAQDQGWQVTKEKKTVVFCPPNPNKPKLTLHENGSGVNFFDLRNLKRAGLIWPWTPPIKAKAGQTLVQELVPESWRVLGDDPDYEISNAARCREKATGKLIMPDPSGEVALTKGGRTRYKSVRGLVISHFGHPPLKNVTLSDEAMGHRAGESKAILDSITTTNQEDQEVSLPLKTPDELPALEEGWGYIKCVPEAIDGYAVSVNGELRGPDGKSRAPSKIGHQLWAYLRRFDKPKGNRAVRLDRLVLLTHEGSPLDPKDQPIHKDGNSFNCALSNLAWPAAGQNVSRITVVPDLVEDEAMEPQHVQVSVEEAVDALEADFEADTAELERSKAEEATEGAEAPRYEHQDYVDKVVAEAPSFVNPDVTVGEMEKRLEQGETLEDIAEAAPKPRRKRKSRAKTPAQRAAAHRAKATKEASPAPMRGVLSGRYWHHEETGLVMFVGDDGTVEFPKVDNAEDSRALLSLAALAQEWITMMGIG